MKHLSRTVTLLVSLAMSCMSAFSSPVRIMPCGDSITRGFYTDVIIYNSYRKELTNLLLAGGYDVDLVGAESDGDFADNQHEGHNGWHADEAGTTDDILGHIAGWMAVTPADIVLLHIGTNDILARDASATEVSAVLDVIFGANSNATVVLALIINADPATYDWTDDVSTFNSNLNAMAQARIGTGDDLVVVDMEHDADLDYASADMIGFHPSQTGYDKMATNWFPAVELAIGRQRIKHAPHIRSITTTSNTVALKISNLDAGSSVGIEQATSLASSNWVQLDSLIATNALIDWADPGGTTNSASFYRAVTP